MAADIDFDAISASLLRIEAAAKQLQAKVDYLLWYIEKGSLRPREDPRKRAILHQIVSSIASGTPSALAIKQGGISSVTYYKWRKDAKAAQLSSQSPAAAAAQQTPVESENRRSGNLP